jgi:hypothetical protein
MDVSCVFHFSECCMVVLSVLRMSASKFGALFAYHLLSHFVSGAMTAAATLCFPGCSHD